MVRGVPLKSRKLHACKISFILPDPTKFRTTFTYGRRLSCHDFTCAVYITNSEWLVSNRTTMKPYLIYPRKILSRILHCVTRSTRMRLSVDKIIFVLIKALILASHRMTSTLPWGKSGLYNHPRQNTCSHDFRFSFLLSLHTPYR